MFGRSHVGVFLESNLSEILKIQSEIFYNVRKIFEKYQSFFMDSQVIRYELLRRYFLDVFLTLLGTIVLRNLFERLFPNIYHHIAIIHKQSQTKLFRKLGNFLRKTYMLKLGLCKAVVHWKVKWSSNVPLILSR